MPRFAVALTGAEGMLGQALLPALSRCFDLHPFTLVTLDITDEKAVERAFAPLPRDRLLAVVNCAAFTDVDACESRRAEAFAVNAGGAGILARAAAAAGARLVHISTDYVFDGGKRGPYLPGDPPCPINAYGESKLAGEEEVRAAGGPHLILRTSWLYGPGGRNFPATMLALAKSRPTLSVVDDQRGRPTFTRDLADGIARLLGTPLTGTHHLANDGECTWYGLARETLRLRGWATPLHPVGSEAFPRPARRPANSVLDCSSAWAALGAPLPRWEDALRRYLCGEGAPPP